MYVKGRTGIASGGRHPYEWESTPETHALGLPEHLLRVRRDTVMLAGRRNDPQTVDSFRDDVVPEVH